MTKIYRRIIRGENNSDRGKWDDRRYWFESLNTTEGEKKIIRLVHRNGRRTRARFVCWKAVADFYNNHENTEKRKMGNPCGHTHKIRAIQWEMVRNSCKGLRTQRERSVWSAGMKWRGPWRGWRAEKPRSIRSGSRAMGDKSKMWMVELLKIYQLAREGEGFVPRVRLKGKI